jgi:hypothetical protein
MGAKRKAGELVGSPAHLLKPELFLFRLRIMNRVKYKHGSTFLVQFDDGFTSFFMQVYLI